MGLKRFKFILLVILLSGFLSTSCGVLKSVKYIDEFIDVVRTMGKKVDDIPSPKVPKSNLSDIPEASRVLKEFIQKAAATSASRTESTTLEFIESGQSKIPRQSIWNFAYDIALEELLKTPERIKTRIRIERFKDVATEIANQVTEDIEQEVENKYEGQVEIY